ncbi:MAG: UDP-N-acetylmuramoyl-L-alanyl-D-glutamate--2,6-diaminopimelate ligase [Gammaproteobacteria bacterium]|nr:UDP-N-acetylmuramoyl-L-alanyl-D-glutamate--2,6-diaminopimelate ligase [Gammaproteobacteria bacterium]
MKNIDAETGAPLSVLLRGLADVPAGLDAPVRGISLDSRTLQAGDTFIALAGQRDHGWRHRNAAVRAGAAAILADVPDAGEWRGPAGVPVIRVPDLAHVAGVIAARFFGDPSRQLRVVGVTGTNGKTSTCHYLAQALHELVPGHAGVIGTLGYGRVDRLEPAALTTPDPISLQRELARQRDAGVKFVAMEVSSHALALDRISGVHFHCAVFTNLTRDHLDFHGDMDAYGAAKRLLFATPELQHAVVNLDDAFGRELARDCAAGIKTTGYRLMDAALPDVAPMGELLGRLLASGPGTLALELSGPWGRGRLQCALTGRFNASNLLAACAALCLLDVPFASAVKLLGRATAVPGRMEAFHAPGRPMVVVDYAHTPDAVQKALQALRPQCRGRLICVLGCGGDRDPGKRPQMGAAAELHADGVVITSDNPRSEEPRAIISAILAGMRSPGAAIVEPDRPAAIARAIRDARAGDVVLVAGKGHETYQEIAGRRLPYSDRQLVRALLERSA